MPSLEVAPTTLAQRTRQTTTDIRHVTCFRKICQLVTCIHSRKGTLFILWPWTLTYNLCLSFELELDNVKINRHAQYLGRRSFSSKRRTGLIALYMDVHVTCSWTFFFLEPTVSALIEPGTSCFCTCVSLSFCVFYERTDIKLIEWLIDWTTNKSSAVAEMGDRGHNRHGSKRGGCCAPFAVSSKKFN